MTSLTPQRKSARTCRHPDRFIPDASAWAPSLANGAVKSTKNDHPLFTFNGHVCEPQAEKKNNCNYENAFVLPIKNDKETEKDLSFIGSDHDSDYDSAHSWSCDEDDDEVECEQCGRRWDGHAQCFPCVSDDESDQEIEDELLQNHKEDIANE